MGRRGRARRERAEAERLARFAEQCALLEAQGMRGQDKTFSQRASALLGFLCALPFAAGAVVAFSFRGGKSWLLTGNLFADLALYILVFLASIPVHECLHALGWAAAKGSFAGLRICLSGGTPYCACAQPLGRWRYLAGTLAPFLVLGAGLSAAGIAAASLPLTLYGAFNLLNAGADVLVSLRALASRGLLLDHPSRCGFCAFSRA